MSSTLPSRRKTNDLTARSSDNVRPMNELLAEVIDDQAEWRRRNARAYPDDGRNARSARALADLAAFVRALPEDDPTVWALAAHGYVTSGPGSTLMLGDETLTVLGRYGFDGEESADRLEFLKRLLRHEARAEQRR